MGKYVKIAACLGVLLALPVAASAANFNVAVVDANGALVNNAAVSFDGAKGLPSASGLWTASVPNGKISLIVDHPAVGTQRVDLMVDAADVYAVARVANGEVTVRIVNQGTWPGATIGSLDLTGEAVRLPGPMNVTGFTSPAVILPPYSPAAGGGCGSVLVTQNNDPNTVEAVASVSCNAGGVNVDNYYARSFNMAVEYPGAPSLLKCLDLGVETNVLDYNITVNIYHDPSGGDPTDGPPAVDHCGMNDWILLDSSVVFVPDGTSLGFVTANYGAGLGLPADATIVVEVFTPDRQVTDNGSFFLGANSTGQTASAWLASATCGLNCYLTTDAIGFPNSQWVMRLDIDPAGPVFGACCDDSTAGCADGVELQDCAGRFAADTLCSALDPACGDLGACCMPDGSCVDGQFPGDCAAAGGTYQGMGTACSGVSCPQPPDGACCAGDGTCSIANEFTCAGTFQGGGSVCTPNPCPQNFVCTSGVGGQLPDQAGHGGGGTVGATSDMNPAAGFAVADNFTPAADGTINSVCWWGFYVDFGGPFDCGPGSGDDFTITYYSDGGPIPGAVIAGPFTVPTQGFPTGAVIPSGIGDIIEYGYEATHPAVAVTAGTCYWVEIVNHTTASCFWLWSTAPPGDNRAAQDNAGYAATDWDVAFALDIAFDTSACSLPDPCESGTGDCCAATGAPACGDPVCCALVCATDAYCCEVEYDGVCAGIAQGFIECGCNTDAPPNDLCADAVAVTVPSLTAGTTIFATLDPVGDCGTSTTSGGVWYSVTGTGNFMTATTCENQSPPGSADYDTKISIFCQGCDVPLCVDGNDDESGCSFHSTIGWCSQAGVEYLIMVHGFSSGTGNFELSVFDTPGGCSGGVECTPPPPTGACCYADTTCDIQSDEDCTAAGGTWQGADTECFAAGAVNNYSSSPGAAIPDADPTGTSDTINVADVFDIGDVDLGLIISHTWAGDLCAIVEHGGTTVTVVQRIGDTGGLVCDAAGCCGLNADNLDVILDDEAAGGPINDAASEPIVGNFTPEQALNAFDGAAAAGDWTITIVDNAGGDTGTLDSWSLAISTGETICAECGNDIVEPGEECDGGDCCNVDCTFATGECRPAADGCDVAESCTGTSADCPADAFAGTGTVCRPAAGDCDVADNCDGNGGCDADAKSSDVCRDSTGSCDPGEACDGVGDHCPADVVIVDCSGDTIDGCCAPGCNANDDADCVPECGNGVQEEGEECDDGNADETDSCTFECEERQPVPTVSQWGLVILALLILAAAKVYFSRRQATA